MWRVLVAFVVAGLIPELAAQGGAGESAWTEWRGGDLQGSARVENLPDAIDPAAPKWKVPVRGEGISSPIVVGERVFLTTAHRHDARSDGPATRVPLLSLLVLAGMLGLAVLLGGRGTAAGRLRLADAGLVGVATGASLALLAAAELAPDRLWTLGRPGEAWLRSGAVVLLALAAAVGWTRGVMRLLATLGLVVVSALFWLGVPLDRYGVEHDAGPRTAMVLPALLLGCWFLVSWIRLPRPLPRRRAIAIARGCGGLSLAAAGLVLFWSVNVVDRRDGLARSILCYDLHSGEALWERVVLVADKEQKWPINSYATPTPCSDGERVFAYFGVGWGCVDLDGELLWTGEDPDYLANARYGCGASPIVDGDQVLIWQENEMKNRESFFMALDFATGEVRWRVEPQDVNDSYSTPILVPRPNGERELVTMAYRKLVAHSTRDGSRLWDLDLPARQMVPSLCYAGDDLLLVSGGTHLEFSTSGIRLHGAGRSTKPEVLWQTRRNLSDICSPVLIDGLFFTVIDGRLRCIDPESGTIHWHFRLAQGEYWSSLVAGDGKVYTLGSEGDLTTIAVDRTECRVLSEAWLDDACMATPAVVEGRLIVRTARHLYCFAGP